MSILIYAEYAEGKFKKVAFELASYAKKVAETLGTTVTAVTVNAGDVSELSKYGVDKVLKVNNDKLSGFTAKAYADVIKQAAQKENVKLVLLSSTTDSIYLSSLVAVALEAGYASNVVGLPVSTSPFQVKRNAFSNKAFNITEIATDVKVLGLAKNSYGVFENASTLTQEDFNPTIGDNDFGVKVESVEKGSGKVSIADADIVVSAGRGLKGPENWGMVEELATVLGAATACSKPVSDLGWRPHGEHVGQTGKPVATNLYIAIGISGAIQHIAGINSSKVKVVINSDPEAPFFKVADYGVVGDAFEIVPKLIEKFKAFKAQNS
ncbi:electron transfer flavoprotein subunit alpha/FixB family protein [Flavobacterium sp. LB2P84]|jgi:electron transfer flavoprotein alpha subunit|uniref:Electron transfer flavoprotein subunit alpha/FixB family protein n=1 Tax=Flavobacterium yafengii TaxID=3041253 RepID=A0AAW6TKG0_9FLAO|nr:MULTISPECIES: electron transfer flavoprotein subunit alpha/FixB family protein [Flavobacterium]MDI5898898.1 electron transfer flavoprotein subunit alpha/FixB family protein [Flavobacterium yafengii]MDI5948088.1 electron transfer flavoprotein subunit alpha/FixB family protein [Flavobacterium yafengii]MDI6033216.1 electron transfer flavoprotein subunit alpha/FixB family protein [Flavobacterium yafengii]MDI6049885.1 electron transfer flavoprotein subunit alpha/FixB family protein [Flavobacteriu